MKLVDLNVLLHVVNDDSPRHGAVLDWWNAAVLVSCDTDFGRFKGLRWENPLG